MEEYYEEANDNMEDYMEEDESVKYIRLEYKMDEMMENIYNDVIVPYLDCICQKEILHNLDEFTVGTFQNFFRVNSPYYKYVLNKTENK